MKLKTLLISDDLALPLESVTQKFAFMGQSGGGKTYAAMKLAELMLDAGVQVIALDPVGTWWGLRSSANGKQPGFSINVFGGNRGDIPLTPESASLVADVLAERGVSAVLDVSEFTTADLKRFVRDFADQFFHQKKKNVGPVHVFFEEAQTFAPQVPERDEGVMLNRVERLLKLGRNYGVGWSLISQQPQAVHKRVLNQAGILFALRTIGKHERKAIDEWVTGKVTSESEINLLESLPSLETGEAHVWSPSFLKVSKTVKISKKITFDSSSTPTVGQTVVKPAVLAPVEIASLKEAMKEAVTKAEQDDPALLHKRIKELETELSKAQKTTPKTEVQKIEVPILKDQQIKRLESVVEKILSVSPKFSGMGNLLCSVADDIKSGIARPQTMRLPTPNHPLPSTPKDMVLYHPQSDAIKAKEKPTQTNGELRLPRGAKDILGALASTMKPSLSKRELAMLSGLRMNSGTFWNYVSTLRTNGLIDEPSKGEYKITENGKARAGISDVVLVTQGELVNHWRRKLPGKSREMFSKLLDIYPQSIPKEELANKLGMESSSGTFHNYISTLVSWGLADRVDGSLVATAALQQFRIR